MDRLPQLFSRAPAETLIQSSGKKPPVKLTLPIDPIGSTSASTDVPIVNAAQTNTARSELLLVCEARSTTLSDGSWRFSLESANGTPIFDAEDQEMGDLNRLTLLAAVRGLEAIEGPSSVTLISNNRYLIRSLSDSLPRWRQNGFMWEHFGRRVDVQNADLWRRVDRALQIHRVEACLVSTRLVSPGQDVVAETPAGTVQHRLDGAHANRASGSVPAPKMRRAKSGTSQEADQQNDQAGGDRLRSWLLGGQNGAMPLQRRFTAEDLLQRT